MKGIHWIALSLLSVLVIAPLLTACSNASTPSSPAPSAASSAFKPLAATASPTPKSGGILKIGVSSDAVAIGNPGISSQTNIDAFLSRPAVERVCSVDEQGKTVPWLLESIDGDYSTLAITEHIRKGVRFSDGTDLNADAFIWNYQLNIDNKSSNTALVKSLEKIDDYTIKVNLKEWDADAAFNVSSIYIVSPTAWQKNGKDWGMQNPVGTGPFKLASRQPDTLIKYVKNSDYWQKGKPSLDELDLVIIKDPVTRLAAFKAGEIDIDLDPTFDQAKDMKNDPKYTLQVDHGAGSFRLGPDGGNADSPMANIKVRQAIAYAIDRQALVDSVFNGFAVVATQWNPPGTWSYNTDLKGYAYDPEKAKSLLKEAGYDANNPLKTTLIGQNTDWGPITLQAIQNMLAKVNIQADVNTLALPALSTVWNKGWKNGIGIRQLPPAPFMLSWDCSYLVYSNRATWVSLLNDPALDALAHKMNSAPDLATRTPLAWQMMDLLYYQDVQQIPLLISDALAAKYPYAKDEGIYTTPLTGEWHPENGWLNK